MYTKGRLAPVIRETFEAPMCISKSEAEDDMRYWAAVGRWSKGFPRQGSVLQADSELRATEQTIQDHSHDAEGVGEQVRGSLLTSQFRKCSGGLLCGLESIFSYR